MLNGVDLASPYQTGFPKLGQDFVIVKFTEGTYYTNPDRITQIATAELKAAYHFTAGTDVIAEANFFLQTFKPYIGQAIPVLDYEGTALNKWTPTQVEQWLDYVYQKTDTKPWLYMALSTENSKNWASVAAKYPLWVAQYNNGITTGFQPRNLYGKLAHQWNWAAFQYAGGNGRLAGWGNGQKAVDLDVCYWTKEQWQFWVNKSSTDIVSLHPVVKWNVNRVFVVTTPTGCNLYDSPDLTKIIKHLNYGSSWAVLAEKDGALELGKNQWVDGRDGFSKSNPLATHDKLSGQLKIIAANTYSLYKPADNATKADKLTLNQLYDVTGRQNKFFMLQEQFNGQTVYVSGDNAYVVL
ncbi:GH25 family lysozyme [Lactobacillus sp. ESL0791]|uniref:GH25 family lysozyme n=1 Tax=Lactobacillus sp. ESL0791 TaxID=2983234 RepID=UPI0023F7137D|nr:GH25 family lysozyme [Lactobacillus sp. ESL0791]MDF7639978.1 GH25 family lysozyme [Lactobacillus sp. ESL0791]